MEQLSLLGYMQKQSCPQIDIRLYQYCIFYFKILIALQLFAVEKDQGNERTGTLISFRACIYTIFLNNFVAVTFRKEHKKDIGQTPKHC